MEMPPERGGGQVIQSRTPKAIVIPPPLLRAPARPYIPTQLATPSVLPALASSSSSALRYTHTPVRSRDGFGAGGRDAQQVAARPAPRAGRAARALGARAHRARRLLLLPPQEVRRLAGGKGARRAAPPRARQPAGGLPRHQARAALPSGADRNRRAVRALRAGVGVRAQHGRPCSSRRAGQLPHRADRAVHWSHRGRPPERDVRQRDGAHHRVVRAGAGQDRGGQVLPPRLRALQPATGARHLALLRRGRQPRGGPAVRQEASGREHGPPHPGRAVPVAATAAALRRGRRGALRRHRHHDRAQPLPRVQRRHAARVRRVPLLPAQDPQPALRAAGGGGRRRDRGDARHRTRQRALLARLHDRAHLNPVRVRRRHHRAYLQVLGALSELHRHHPAPDRRQRGGARRGHYLCSQEQAGYHARSSFGVGNPDIHVCGPTERHRGVDCRDPNGSRLPVTGDRLALHFSISNRLHPPGWELALSQGNPPPPMLRRHWRVLFRDEATNKQSWKRQQRRPAGGTNRCMECTSGMNG